MDPDVDDLDEEPIITQDLDLLDENDNEGSTLEESAAGPSSTL